MRRLFCSAAVPLAVRAFHRNDTREPRRERRDDGGYRDGSSRSPRSRPGGDNGRGRDQYHTGRRQDQDQGRHHRQDAPPSRWSGARDDPPPPRRDFESPGRSLRDTPHSRDYHGSDAPAHREGRRDSATSSQWAKSPEATSVRQPSVAAAAPTTPTSFLDESPGFVAQQAAADDDEDDEVFRRDRRRAAELSEYAQRRVAGSAAPARVGFYQPNAPEASSAPLGARQLVPTYGGGRPVRKQRKPKPKGEVPVSMGLVSQYRSLVSPSDDRTSLFPNGPGRAAEEPGLDRAASHYGVTAAYLSSLTAVDRLILQERDLGSPYWPLSSAQKVAVEVVRVLRGMKPPRQHNCWSVSMSFIAQRLPESTLELTAACGGMPSVLASFPAVFELRQGLGNVNNFSPVFDTRQMEEHLFMRKADRPLRYVRTVALTTVLVEPLHELLGVTIPPETRAPVVEEPPSGYGYGGRGRGGGRDRGRGGRGRGRTGRYDDDEDPRTHPAVPFDQEVTRAITAGKLLRDPSDVDRSAAPSHGRGGGERGRGGYRGRGRGGRDDVPVVLDLAAQRETEQRNVFDTAEDGELLALNVMDFVPFFPTFFVPVPLVLPTLPEGYTAAHLEAFFARTKAFQFVRLDVPTADARELPGMRPHFPPLAEAAPSSSTSHDEGDGKKATSVAEGGTTTITFVRLHGHYGQFDVQPAAAANERFRAYDPHEVPLDSAIKLFSRLPLHGRPLPLHTLLSPQLTAPDVAASLGPALGVYPVSLFFFAQSQHVFKFSAPAPVAVQQERLRYEAAARRYDEIRQQEEAAERKRVADARGKALLERFGKPRDARNNGSAHQQMAAADDGADGAASSPAQGSAASLLALLPAEVPAVPMDALGGYVARCTASEQPQWFKLDLKPSTTPCPLALDWVLAVTRHNPSEESEIVASLPPEARRQLTKAFPSLEAFVVAHPSCLVMEKREVEDEPAPAPSQQPREFRPLVRSNSRSDDQQSRGSPQQRGDAPPAVANGRKRTVAVVYHTREWEKEQRRNLSLAEQLQAAMRCGDKRQVRLLRKRLLREEVPDSPLLGNKEVLGRAVAEFLPSDEHVKVTVLLQALNRMMTAALPPSYTKFFRALPHIFTLFEFGYGNNYCVQRAGLPLPDGALRDDYDDAQLCALLERTLDTRRSHFALAANVSPGARNTRSVESVLCTIPNRARTALRERHGSLEAFVARYPQRFALVATGTGSTHVTLLKPDASTA